MGLISSPEYFDSVAEIYDGFYQTPVSMIENRLVMDALPEDNVIDLGCGTGIYLKYCTPSKYLGIDTSPGMLEVARKAHPQRPFELAGMESLPVPDNSFKTAISLFGSMSYCIAPLKAVNEIYRVLETGGVSYVMLYTETRMNNKSESLIHQVSHKVKVKTYTVEDARILFSEFDTVEVRGVNLLLNGLRFLPTRLLSFYAKLENMTLSRLLRVQSHFLMVKAGKNA